MASSYVNLNLRMKMIIEGFVYATFGHEQLLIDIGRINTHGTNVHPLKTNSTDQICSHLSINVYVVMKKKLQMFPINIELN